jgi:hypothetical protein
MRDKELKSDPSKDEESDPDLARAKDLIALHADVKLTHQEGTDKAQPPGITIAKSDQQIKLFAPRGIAATAEESPEAGI